jgi:hypothetical protein
MFAANTHVIRLATNDDVPALRKLAELDSQRVFCGPALIGEIDGVPAAAVSLIDGRVIADPFRRTAPLVSYLRVRAQALKAYESTPSLRDRLRAALPASYRTQSAVEAAA